MSFKSQIQTQKVFDSLREVYLLKSRLKTAESSQRVSPPLGLGFFECFHIMVLIDFCFELEGSVSIGSANILILHSPKDESLCKEEKQTKYLPNYLHE